MQSSTRLSLHPDFAHEVADLTPTAVMPVVLREMAPCSFSVWLDIPPGFPCPDRLQRVDEPRRFLGLKKQLLR